MKAWCVTHPNYNGGAYVHAETRSKARYQVWIGVKDVLPFRLIDLDVKREKHLDDKPITARSLLDTIGGTDVSPSCRCAMCLEAKKRNNEPY